MLHKQPEERRCDCSSRQRGIKYQQTQTNEQSDEEPHRPQPGWGSALKISPSMLIRLHMTSTEHISWCPVTACRVRVSDSFHWRWNPNVWFTLTFLFTVYSQDSEFGFVFCVFAVPPFIYLSVMVQFIFCFTLLDHLLLLINLTMFYKELLCWIKLLTFWILINCLLSKVLMSISWRWHCRSLYNLTEINWLGNSHINEIKLSFLKVLKT